MALRSFWVQEQMLKTPLSFKTLSMPVNITQRLVYT